MPATLVNVSLWYLEGSMNNGATQPVPSTVALDENVDTPTVSKQTTAAPAALAPNAAWRIVPVGGPVYMNYGANPTAAAGNTYLAEGTEFWKTAFPNEKLAFIDA